MMAEPASWLDHDQVEAEWEHGHWLAVGLPPGVPELESGAMQARPLATIDGLLGQAEVAPRPPSDLDDHERRRRSRIDGEQVDLRSADTELPPEHPPAQ